MNCKTKIINKSEIGIIKALWEKLNEIHLENSHYFKNHFQTFTFEKRCEHFIDVEENNIRIELVIDNEVPVGYCISTIGKGVGEIDSIFIEEQYRKHGFGKNLLGNSMKWFKENNCFKIQVGVAEGNESVFGFYQKFNLYPAMNYLYLKG